MTVVDRGQAVGLLVLTLLAGGPVLAVGCGGDTKPAESPTPATSASAASTATAPVTASSAAAATTAAASVSAAPPAASSAAPLTTILTTDPNQLSQMYSAAAAAATATTGPAGTDAADTGLKALAAKQAAGMHPDGPVSKGMLQQGGHLEMLVTLVPGKCYSILGYSPVPGVKDLDLHLLAPPLYNILSGEDTTDDNTPIVAKAPNPMCPVVPVPLPYKVDIFAEKGAGPVAVQLYSKAK